MNGETVSHESVLLGLERKRLLDFVWVVTLAVEVCALALLGWMGLTEHSGVASRATLLFGALFVVATDLSYRIKTPRAIRLSVCGSQCVGMLFLVYLWTLSGGVANPGALAFFVPPLLVSGLVGIRWMAAGSAAFALVGTWGVAYHNLGVVPWDAFSSGAPAIAVQSARLLSLWSVGAIAVAVGSNALSAALIRLHQRI